MRLIIQKTCAPHHILASLVKGRWLDGKAQALILSLYICDTHTFSIYQTFLPSRRRDCHTTPTVNEIFHPHTFITNYTKSVVSLFNYHLYIYIAISILFLNFLLFPLSHPLQFLPPRFVTLLIQLSAIRYTAIIYI